MALAAQLDDTTLDVTELPVKKWTQDYKEHLESLLKADEKVLPVTALVKLSRFDHYMSLRSHRCRPSWQGAATRYGAVW